MDPRKKRIKKDLHKKDPENEVEPFVLTENQQPFLNPLIVQNLLAFCKVNSANAKEFSKLRSVCKIWDAECSKVSRQETQIPIPRLLQTYPNGLGWTRNRYNLATDSIVHFKCPLPETRDFENFHFTATCDSSKDRKVLQWFSLMGEQVKSLHFTSALSCFHHSDILANILHKWCPNLETLHLDDIQCFSSLIFIFEGKLTGFQSFKGCDLICKKLKNLTISVEDDSEHKDCHCKVGQMPQERAAETIFVLKRILFDFHDFIDWLPNRDFTFDPGVTDLFFQLIESGTPDILSNILKRYLAVHDGIDWGLLGRILQSAPIQKLVIRKVQDDLQSEDLIMFLLLHPGKIRSTLNNLEFQNVPLPAPCLKAISLLKCKLLRIRLDKIEWCGYSKRSLTDILKNNASTLTNFEVGVEEITLEEDNDDESVNMIEIPFMPKLESFTNKTVGMLYVDGLEFFRNAPNLVKCHIYDKIHESTSEVRNNNVVEALRIFCAYFEDPLIVEHPLRELKLDVSLDIKHLKLLRKGLTNLEKVELRIRRPSDMILGFSNGDGWEMLQAATFTIGLENKKNWMKFRKISNTDIGKCFSKLKGLKFFELKFDSNGTDVMPASIFANGFTKLQSLVSLKINNLCILTNEKERVDQSISHIPFVLLPELKVVEK